MPKVDVEPLDPWDPRRLALTKGEIRIFIQKIYGFRCSEQTITKWIKYGRELDDRHQIYLKAHALNGRLIINKADLLRFLDEE